MYGEVRCTLCKALLHKGFIYTDYYTDEPYCIVCSWKARKKIVDKLLAGDSKR